MYGIRKHSVPTHTPSSKYLSGTDNILTIITLCLIHEVQLNGCRFTDTQSFLSYLLHSCDLSSDASLLFFNLLSFLLSLIAQVSIEILVVRQVLFVVQCKKFVNYNLNACMEKIIINIYKTTKTILNCTAMTTF